MFSSNLQHITNTSHLSSLTYLNQGKQGKSNPILSHSESYFPYFIMNGFLILCSDVFWNGKSSGQLPLIRVWYCFYFHIFHVDWLLGHRDAQRQGELPVGCGIWCWTGRVSRSDHWWWVLVPDWSLQASIYCLYISLPKFYFLRKKNG